VRAFPFGCLLLIVAASACATTTVRSGRPPADFAPGYDERWHPAFLFEVIPGHDTYDLSRVCPKGWAQVTVTRDPFTLFASVITLFIYSPSRISIVCAVPESHDPPPQEGYAPSATKALPNTTHMVPPPESRR